MKTQRISDNNRNERGYTLIELMMTAAILAIIASIAIPSYTGYISGSRQTAVRSNIEPLRLAEEDYWLDNGTYVAGSWIPGGATTLESGVMNWKPDGDEGKFNYQVTISGTNNAVITVQHREDTTITVSTALSK